MITKEPINRLKHKSEKQIINLLYKNFNSEIASLINQTGNLFEVILKPSADFEKILLFIQEYADQEKKTYKEYEGMYQGDGFSLIFLLQIGNSKKEVVPINSKYIVYQVDYLDRERTMYLVQIFGSKRIDLYENYMYKDFLVKYKGEWFIHGNQELADILGSKIENDGNFEILGFEIEDYKKYSEE